MLSALQHQFPEEEITFTSSESEMEMEKDNGHEGSENSTKNGHENSTSTIPNDNSKSHTENKSTKKKKKKKKKAKSQIDSACTTASHLVDPPATAFEYQYHYESDEDEEFYFGGDNYKQSNVQMLGPAPPPQPVELQSLMDRMVRLESGYSQVTRLQSDLEAANSKISALQAQLQWVQSQQLLPLRHEPFKDEEQVHLLRPPTTLENEDNDDQDATNNDSTSTISSATTTPPPQDDTNYHKRRIGRRGRRSVLVRNHQDDHSNRNEESNNNHNDNHPTPHNPPRGRTSIFQRLSLAITGGGNDDDGHELTLPEDTFSFMVLVPFHSYPFVVSVMVFTTQMTVFLLMLFDISDWGAPDNNWFGIPANIDPAVRAAQVVALIITILTQGDVIKGLELIRVQSTEGFQQAMPHKGETHWKVQLWLCIAFLLTEGR